MPNAGEGVQGQNQHFLCHASGEELQAPSSKLLCHLQDFPEGTKTLCTNTM